MACCPQVHHHFTAICQTAPAAAAAAAGTGTFRFSHPSTQQHLLVWRDRPKVVMVIKKLGRELLPEFLEVRRTTWQHSSTGQRSTA
jgi:hypothetical protein